MGVNCVETRCCRTLDEWGEQMKKAGSPGDDIALDALATMLQINFLLHLPNGGPIHHPALTGGRFGDGYLHIAQVPLAGALTMLCTGCLGVC